MQDGMQAPAGNDAFVREPVPTLVRAAIGKLKQGTCHGVRGQVFIKITP
ncbi:Uncharacterised protein [Pseudomonas fluorescens]|uniref:Uncharacterized protein n=1 Tax=Pseudomonas fluorescens TaxID=294 RepID=A0A379IGX1_PSEFL|nr:Uncharacterised protein [Pseudomonas fluorescens]